MKLSIFTNDVLTKGAILGGVMLASLIAENLMLIYGCSLNWMIAFMFEWLVAAGLFCYLLYRFTSNYSRLVMAERENGPYLPYFSYGEGWLYVVKISILAGIVVSVGGYVFQYLVIGDDTYIEATANLVRNITADITQGQVSAATQEMYASLEQNLAEIKAMPKPSFFSVLLSGITSYLFIGSIIGLIVAAITKREPRLFDTENR